MKILLLNPPFLNRFSREQRSPAVTKSGTLYYPMWLCYAAGYLEQQGHQVVLIDSPADSLQWPEIESRITVFAPEMVVLDTSTPSIYNDVEVGAKIKAVVPKSMVVLVGPHVSALPEETLKINPAIDAVAIREYEHTLAELAEVIGQRGDPTTVKGLAFRKGEKIFVAPQRPLAEDLDSLPFVSAAYLKHLDHRHYFYGHSEYPIVTIITGRGCPHQCVFCVYPQVFCSRKPRLRSIPNVVNEIEFILKNYPDVKSIMFEDDTLTFNKKRCVEFAEEVLKRGLKFKWSANSRCDIDLETMQLLKKAGADLFCVGVESGDQGVLDQMKKSLKVERVRQFFKDAKQAGIRLHGCFMVGNPGETKQTLETTLEFAKELNPDTAQFYPIMVYPGTEAYEWAKSNGFLTTTDFREWLTPEGMHNSIVSRPGLTSRDLVEFCDRARREYYLRPWYLMKKIWDGLRQPAEFQRLLIGFKTFARFLFRGADPKKKSC
ncbi:MAG: radical SAM protein [bacterium]|nr:radical SAM protein [bacterium]